MVLLHIPRGSHDPKRRAPGANTRRGCCASHVGGRQARDILPVLTYFLNPPSPPPSPTHPPTPHVTTRDPCNAHPHLPGARGPAARRGRSCGGMWRGDGTPSSAAGSEGDASARGPSPKALGLEALAQDLAQGCPSSPRGDGPGPRRGPRALWDAQGQSRGVALDALTPREWGPSPQ